MFDFLFAFAFFDGFLFRFFCFFFPSASAAAPLSYSSVFLAGTVSGAAQLAVIVPVDLLKIRAQLSRARLSQKMKNAEAAAAAALWLIVVGEKEKLTSFFSPLTSAVSSAWRDGGGSVRGLYRGGLVTALRDVPSHGVYFACYELCRELLDPGSRSRSLNGGGRSGENESENGKRKLFFFYFFFVILFVVFGSARRGRDRGRGLVALRLPPGRDQDAGAGSDAPRRRRRQQEAGSVAGGGRRKNFGDDDVRRAHNESESSPSLPRRRRCGRRRAGGLWNGLSSTLVSLRRGVNEFSSVLFRERRSKRPRNKKTPSKSKLEKLQKNPPSTKKGPRLRRQRGPVLLLRVPDRAHGREGPGGRRRPLPSLLRRREEQPPRRRRLRPRFCTNKKTKTEISFSSLFPFSSRFFDST